MTMKSRDWRLTPLQAAAACLLGAAGFPVLAQESPYTIGVLETISHDSNVYRAQTGSGQVSSDWISTTGILGTYATTLGRGSLKAGAEFDVNRFNRDKTLDGTTRSEHVDGMWSTIERISGEWGLSDTSQLYRYNPNSTSGTAVVGVRNVETIDRGYIGAHLGVVTPLTFDLTGHVSKEGYSAPSYKSLDLTSWDAGAGVTYRSTPDLSFSVSFRHTNGKYTNYGDTFDRNDIVLGVFYMPTGLTQFSGQLTDGRESHSLLSQRDSSNVGAQAQWQWQVTGKTQFRMSFEHGDDTDSSSLFQGTQLNAEAFRHTSATAGVYYAVSSKVQANVTGGFSHRNLDSAFSSDASPGQHGKDNLYTGGVGLTYMPTRLSSLGCNASHERRTTSGASLGLTYPYTATVISCTGQIAFD